MYHQILFTVCLRISSRILKQCFLERQRETEGRKFRDLGNSLKVQNYYSPGIEDTHPLFKREEVGIVRTGFLDIFLRGVLKQIKIIKKRNSLRNTKLEEQYLQCARNTNLYLSLLIFIS